MKNFNMKWVYMFFGTCMCFAFLSCNGNNPDAPSKNEVKNEFGEARYIIGRWQIQTNVSVYQDFRFASNGEEKQNNETGGYWSYTPETKLLATTLHGWSWTINIMNSHALQGITVSSQKSYGFTRLNYVDENPRLIIGKWKSDDNTIECTFDDTNYALTQNGETKSGKYAINYVKGQDQFSSTATITLDQTVYKLTNLQGGFISFNKESDNKYISLYYVE